MTEYVVACTASLANGDVPLVDVSHLEESSGGPNLTIAALPLSGQVKYKIYDAFYLAIYEHDSYRLFNNISA
jgi:ribonuclease PH